jgi:hypothetical protein
MQPRGKRRSASKSLNFSKNVEKNFLSGIFGFLGIPQHAHAQRVDSRTVQPVKPLKSSFVAPLRHPNDLGFWQLTSFYSPLTMH